MWTDTGKLGMTGIMTAVYVLFSTVLGDGSSWSFVGIDCLGVLVNILCFYFGGPGFISSFGGLTAWFDLCHFLQSRYTGTEF